MICGLGSLFLSCFAYSPVACLLENGVSERAGKLRAKLVLAKHRAIWCTFFSAEDGGSNRLDHLVDELLLCLDVQVLLIGLGQASSNSDGLRNG